MTKAIGIDIGGTGIKGAVVDLDTGALLTERIKRPTPKGAEPEDVLATALGVIDELGDHDGLPVGVCVPAMVRRGVTLSAANISKRWLGLDAQELFEQALGKPIAFLNDADAAGYAELAFGAAKGVNGRIMLTTLGTGIGVAVIEGGALLPHAEIGHLEVDGRDVELGASYAAKEREDLSWKQWAKRLQPYYELLERVYFPDLFVIGGGVSKNADDFLPLLRLDTPIVPAVHRNNAGILGVAAVAAVEG